jgi:hypothetical protein
MSKTLMVLLRIAGSVVGLLAGGVLLFWGVCALIAGTTNGNEDAALIGVILLGPVGFLAGTPLGAAVGATIMQKVLRHRSSFWRALLGAVAGLLVGVLPMALCLWTLHEQGVWHDGWWPFFVAIAVVCVAVIAGAVIGSGWKAKPAAEAQS